MRSYIGVMLTILNTWTLLYIVSGPSNVSVQWNTEQHYIYVIFIMTLKVQREFRAKKLGELRSNLGSRAS